MVWTFTALAVAGASWWSADAVVATGELRSNVERRTEDTARYAAAFMQAKLDKIRAEEEVAKASSEAEEAKAALYLVLLDFQPWFSPQEVHETWNRWGGYYGDARYSVPYWNYESRLQSVYGAQGAEDDAADRASMAGTIATTARNALSETASELTIAEGEMNLRLSASAAIALVIVLAAAAMSIAVRRPTRSSVAATLEEPEMVSIVSITPDEHQSMGEPQR